MNHKPTILHLEDKEEDSILVQSEIRKGGVICDYLFVDNETDFIQALENNKVDLILSDYELPDYSGLDALKMVKSNYPRIPFIFVTGVMGEDTAIQSLVDGAVDYVFKSRLQRLASAINRAINEAELLQGKNLAEKERRKEEKKLRASEERLRQVIEVSNEVVWEVDAEGLYTYVSPLSKAVWGYTPEQLVGKLHFYDLHPEKGRDEFKKAAFEVFARKDQFRNLLNLIAKPDGKIIWVETNGIPISDSQNNLMGYLGSDADITERKFAEDEMRKFRTISDKANSGNAISTMDGTLIYVNDAFLLMHGMERDNVIEKNLTIVHNEEQLSQQTGLLEKIKIEGGFTAEELWHTRSDGSTFPTLMSATIIYNENNVAQFMSSSTIDITEKKNAEQQILDLNVNLQQKVEERTRQLAESNERFATFMNFLPAYVFIKDSESKLSYFNKAMDNGLGASKWAEKSLFEIFDRETAERILADDQRTFQTGYRKVEESFITLDGKLHHFETQKFVIPITGQEPLLGGIAVDITERKETEEKINEAKNEAEKANLAKSEFLSRMSHELRTPMNSILGFAQLMQMSELGEGHKKSVNHILTSGKHLLDLINEVLDISRIEAGRITLSIEPVQLESVILEMIDVVQHTAIAFDKKVVLENSPSNRFFVMADLQRLKQVLLNLINNAVKYNRENGSVIIKTELLKTGIQGNDNVRISINDAGYGINSEDLAKLFLPFERIGANENIIEGSGLGLTVVKKLMDVMNGSVGVESVAGEGSTFWIELPLSKSKSAEKRTERLQSGSETGISERSGTILCIEDDMSNLDLVEEILLSHRPEIQLTPSNYGKNAVAMAIEYKPDIILLDLNLPDMHGSEVLSNLLADDQTKSIPVVILSADAMPHQIEKLMIEGARDYLTKPIDVVMFLNVIDEWLGTGRGN